MALSAKYKILNVKKTTIWQLYINAEVCQKIDNEIAKFQWILFVLLLQNAKL